METCQIQVSVMFGHAYPENPCHQVLTSINGSFIGISDKIIFSTSNGYHGNLKHKIKSDILCSLTQTPPLGNFHSNQGTFLLDIRKTENFNPKNGYHGNTGQ